MSDATITSVEFRNFKALSHFSLSLQHVNILVGPNNSGKSTIVGAFRALAAALRRARSRNPVPVPSAYGKQLGHWIDSDTLPISIENVHTDYTDEDSSVDFRLSNGNRLSLFFPADGGCTLTGDAQGRQVRDTIAFRQAYPATVYVVPVLGPVEHEEPLLDEKTVQRNLATHRASRHFRNFWRMNPEGFPEFAELVRSTWPGLTIERPELVSSDKSALAMFCRENRISREIFWAGFGFQIWCQLLTHITRAAEDSLIVIDEPEIYLHPDVQRQLLGILRHVGPDVLLATHSTEIMAEADPSEILLVDKERRRAERVRDIAGVQAAMEAIGSIQNITLTQLARSRRLLFVENDNDIRLLRRFASRLGFASLAAGVGYTAIPSEGFSAWQRIRTLAWGFKHTFRAEMQVGTIFDRDYWPQEQIQEILVDLRQHIAFVHIWERKELENYLLCVPVLERAISSLLADRQRRTGESTDNRISIRALLNQITKAHRASSQAQYVAKRSEYLRGKGQDQATILHESLVWFEQLWQDLDTRLMIVPGKAVLSDLRREVQREGGGSLTDYKIIDAFQPSDIAPELQHVLQELDSFRT